ncbi:MAG: GNAT family N-acetyltransferase [Bacillota bacterium]|nr:GNAT family N-acetyltransferase [Bacillota bacterium]
MAQNDGHVTYRNAVPEDCGMIVSLIKELAKYEHMEDEVVSNEETLRHTMFEEGIGHCLLAEVQGRVAGYALYYFSLPSFLGQKGLFLEDLFVLPEFRGHSIGKGFFHCLAEIAQQENCSRMEWTCLHWNEPSRQFYLSLGAKCYTQWQIFRVMNTDFKLLKSEE